MRLEGKVAIVTGAASGMGAATATRFAAEGAGVACLDIDRTGGEGVVQAIQRAGGSAEFIRCDVSDGISVQAAVGQTVRRFGRLHILVNNAGIYDHNDHLIEDLSEETWDRVMGVNLKGPFYCCRYALPEIVTCGGGAVVNIASTAALAAVQRPTYCASKGALLTFTKAVAKQFAEQGVRANAICPGAIDTPLSAATAAGRAADGIVYPRSGRLMERIGRPEEVAALALFLASDDASFITAAAYAADGGLTAI